VHRRQGNGSLKLGSADAEAARPAPASSLPEFGVASEYTPERCLEAAFRFLLDREPKESILNCSYVSRAIVTWCRLSPFPSRTTTLNSRGSSSLMHLTSIMLAIAPCTSSADRQGD